MPTTKLFTMACLTKGPTSWQSHSALMPWGQKYEQCWEFVMTTPNGPQHSSGPLQLALQQSSLIPSSSAAKRAPDRGIQAPARTVKTAKRSEEHTSELQSLAYLVCRLLLEK